MSPLSILMLGAALLLMYSAFTGNNPFTDLRTIIGTSTTSTAASGKSTKKA